MNTLNSIQDYIYLIYRNKFKILFIIIIGMLLSNYYVKISPKIYNTYITLGLYDNEDKVNTQVNFISPFMNNQNLENEIFLLQSNKMKEKLVQEMPILKIKLFLENQYQDIEFYKNSPFFIEYYKIKNKNLYGKYFYIKPLNENKFQLYIKKKEPIIDFLNKYKINQLLEKYKNYFLIKDIYQLFENKTYEYNNIFYYNKLIKNEHFELKINKNETLNQYKNNLFYLSFYDDESVINSININVNKIFKKGNILKLNYYDNIPDRAADILNNFVLLYLKDSIHRKNHEQEQSLNYVKNQLEKITNSMNIAATQLKDYQQQNHIYNGEIIKENLLNRIKFLENQINNLNNELLLISNLLNKITQSKSLSSISIIQSEFISNNILGLLNKYSELETEYQKQTVKYTDKHPDIIEIKNQIKFIKNSLVKSFQNIKEIINLKKMTMEKELIENNNKISNILDKSIDLRKLEQTLSINKNTHKYLFEKKIALELSMASIISKNDIIDKASKNSYPFKPKIKIIYLTGFFISFVIAILLSLILHITKKQIEYLSDLINFTQIKIIGLIPKSIFLDFNLNNNNNFFVEMYRVIKMNIEHILETYKVNGGYLINVTSTSINEGKSSLITNLAYIYSLSSKSVIIIDADLYQNKITDHFEEKYKTENNLGLMNYLLGDVSYEDIINETETPYICYIKTGFVCKKNLKDNNDKFQNVCKKCDKLDFCKENDISQLRHNMSAVELLEDSRMYALLDKLKSNYDYIIINSSPISLLSNTIKIMKRADLNLFSVMLKKTKKENIQFIEELKNEYNINNIGVIVQNIKNLKRKYKLIEKESKKYFKDNINI